MRNLVLIFAALALTACADRNPMGCSSFSPIRTKDGVVKKETYLTSVGEMSPLVWNGRLITIGIESALVVRDVETKAVMATLGQFTVGNFALPSALLDGGTVYLFGVSGFNSGSYDTTFGNSVLMSRSTDLVTWSPAVEVYRAPGNIKIYNTSVTQGPQGYAMVMEFSTGGGTFHERFATSTNLTQWQDAGSVLNPNMYSSCPSIRHLGGWYYVSHTRELEKGRRWATFVARSRDLNNWQHQSSSQALLSPNDPAPYETWAGVGASCTSDVDYCEFDGQVHLFYYYGDQATWGGYGHAVYNGSLSSMLESFF